MENVDLLPNRDAYTHKHDSWSHKQRIAIRNMKGMKMNEDKLCVY